MNKNDVMKKLGIFKDVENMTSSNGNDVPNQFILYFENGQVFKSYQTIIAVEVCNELYLDPKHDYSNTTSKYCKQFCGMDKKEREKAILEGYSYHYSIVKQIELN